MRYQGIYIPNTNIEEDIEPVLNAIQGKHKSNSGILDIKEIGLGEVTLQKVRQIQKLDNFIMVCIVSYNMNIYRRINS